MKEAEKYKLCVGGLSGQAYISAIDKKGRMTENRRKLTRGEVLAFIHQWAESELERLNDDTIVITAEGEPVCEIKIFKSGKI